MLIMSALCVFPRAPVLRPASVGLTKPPSVTHITNKITTEVESSINGHEWFRASKLWTVLKREGQNELKVGDDDKALGWWGSLFLGRSPALAGTRPVYVRLAALERAKQH